MNCKLLNFTYHWHSFNLLKEANYSFSYFITKFSQPIAYNINLPSFSYSWLHKFLNPFCYDCPVWPRNWFNNISEIFLVVLLPIPQEPALCIVFQLIGKLEVKGLCTPFFTFVNHACSFNIAIHVLINAI